MICWGDDCGGRQMVCGEGVIADLGVRVTLLPTYQLIDQFVGKT